MTWRQMPAALQAPGLKPVEKLVLVGMVYFADQHGDNSYPSQQTLAKICNVGPSTIKRAMRKLREMQLITPVGKGRKGTIRYTVNLPLATLPRIRGVSSATPPRGQQRSTIQYNNPLYINKNNTGDNFVIDRFSSITPREALRRAKEREG